MIETTDAFIQRAALSNNDVKCSVYCKRIGYKLRKFVSYKSI